MGLGGCEGAFSRERSLAPRARRKNSGFDFALKGRVFSRAVAPQNQWRLYGCGKTQVSYQGIASAIPQVLPKQTPL